MNLLVAASIAGSQAYGSIEINDPFISHIYQIVHQTIDQAEKVPGLKDEVFLEIKPELKEKWDVLTSKGVIDVTDTDAKVRPAFVALQALIEHVFSHQIGKSIKSLTGVIHTAAPPTPLCNKGEVSPGLVSASIKEDQRRLFTVNARTTILRDYLHQGGRLYAAYPQSGVSLRSAEQMQIFKDEKQKYPVHLIDHPLDMPTLDDEFSGAFYVVENTDGVKYAFAIKMTQANALKTEGSFGLWFGKLDGTPVKTRIDSVMQVISSKNPNPISF